MKFLIIAILFLFVNSKSVQLDSDISIVSYNIQMLPTTVINTNQKERVGYIFSKILTYDVVIFTEAFDDDIRRTMSNDMEKLFPYRSCILGKIGDMCEKGDKLVCQDGGVIIYSKFPIVEQDQKGFYKTECDFDIFGPPRKECWGSDCSAKKGVLYAKILKNEKYYHIFGSHLQASYGTDAKYRIARDLQLKIISNFITSKHIKQEDAVIIGGDFNIDMLKNDGEFDQMLVTLNAIFFDKPVSGSTYNPKENCLIDGNGQPEFIDYLLFQNGHRSPKKVSVQIMDLRCEKPYTRNGKDCDRLSDHNAVALSANF